VSCGDLGRKFRKIRRPVEGARKKVWPWCDDDFDFGTTAGLVKPDICPVAVKNKKLGQDKKREQGAIGTAEHKSTAAR
jgi:hypothetical protein